MKCLITRVAIYFSTTIYIQIINNDSHLTCEIKEYISPFIQYHTAWNMITFDESAE